MSRGTASRVLAAVAVLAVAAAFSGCTSSPDASGDSGNGDPPPPPLSPLPLYQYQGCSEVVMAIKVPADLVRPHVPSAFELSGALAGAGMASLLAWGTECGRAVSNESVYGPASFFWTIAFVNPVNRSWSDDGFFDYYVFDYIVSNEQVSAKLQGDGVPNRHAAFQVVKNPLPNGDSVWVWTVDSGDGQSRFEHPMGATSTSYHNLTVHLWFGADDFVRVDSKRVNRQNLLTTDGALGTLALDDSIRFRQVVGAPASAWIGSTDTDVEWSLEVSDKAFRAD